MELGPHFSLRELQNLVIGQVQLEQLLVSGHIARQFNQAVFARVQAIEHLLCFPPLAVGRQLDGANVPHSRRKSGESARAQLQHAVLAGGHQCRLNGLRTLLLRLLKEGFVALAAHTRAAF
jgi:hypothetical protein